MRTNSISLCATVSNEAWVTSALLDEEVEKALVLCSSLKRSLTTRRVFVVASTKISISYRAVLNEAFDFVFYLEEDRRSDKLKMDDFAKMSMVGIMHSFAKCVYLAPGLLVLKNCDEIFENHLEGNDRACFVIPENMTNTSVFVFKPSMEVYKALISAIPAYKNGGTGIGHFIHKWSINQCSDEHAFLDEKYNRSLLPSVEHNLMGTDGNVSIVNFGGIDPIGWSQRGKEQLGLIGKLAINHWSRLHKEDVQPLLETHASSLNISSQISLSSPPTYETEPIAIVGMSCRYPRSNNLEEFWNLLFEGEDGISKPPPFRWLPEQSYQVALDAKNTQAGFLKVPIDEFDGKFFGISPKEALFMDPQHRLLHEVIWEGLEDAAIEPHSLRGSDGSVFLGSWINDYKDVMMHSGNTEFYRTHMGTSIGAMTARISFLLGLTGPSIATESGCSSAMVALHLACRSLRSRETSIALAGGVNLLVHAFGTDIMPMVVSKEGHSKTFDENADGFARAEGCGVLVLKRLSDAVQNGDKIWALIRGSGISQEGVSKSMGTPTVQVEAKAMQLALQDAHVRPEDVTYVETHGTGTVVGDPLEVAAIAQAYHSRPRKEPLIIGSVKTNVGHTEACSGITGIMKVVLSMVHETIPAHRNFTKLNPAIDLNAVPVQIPLSPVEWKKSPGIPRIAGVSSFGITGTDAHVIVEESPEIHVSSRSALIISDDAVCAQPSTHLLKISAKTEEALEILLERFKEHITSSENNLADICHTANTGRANFNFRAAIIGNSKKEMVKNIQQGKFLKGEASTEKLGKICFLFTGQGSQYPGMARELHESSPVFRMHFDYCAKILEEMYSVNIKDVMWANDCAEISRTIYSQTSIFCVEFALLKLWESFGVRPSFALGHSLGEFAAAVCAGILTARDALTLVVERSLLIDNLPGGKMLVIKAEISKVQEIITRFAGNDINKRLDVAAVNSREQTVVAGDSEVILNFSKYCIDVANLKCLLLEATHAFHSKHMDPMLTAYRHVASSISYDSSANYCGYISGMKGALISSEDIDADYWVQHTRDKVNFLDASRKAVELGCEIFIEIGPQPVLSALTLMNTDKNILCLPSLKRTENDWATLLNTLARFYVQGGMVNWSGMEMFRHRKKCRLPHYPFIGKKFWPDMDAITGVTIHPLLGTVIPNPTSTKLFKSGLNLKSQEYVKDHAIGQHAVFPGAGYLEMCLAAGLATIEGSTNSLGKPSRPMKIENLSIAAPLKLHESKTCQMQTVVELNTSDSSADWNNATVKIFQKVEGNSRSLWLAHAKATFSPLPSVDDKTISIPNFQDVFNNILESEPNDKQIITQLYDKLASVGLKFGPVFRSVEKLWRQVGTSGLLTKVKVPQDDKNQYIVHPVVLDAMLQSIMMQISITIKKKLYVPIKIGKFIWLSSPSAEDDNLVRYVFVYDPSSSGKTGTHEISATNCSAILLDSVGTPLAILSGLEFVDTTVKMIESVLEQQVTQMPDMWEEVWRAQVGSVQHRQNLEVCNKIKFFDDAFKENILQAHSNLYEERRVEIFGQLEKFCFLSILQALYKLGWSPVLDETFKEEDLFQALKIKEGYRKLFAYYMDVFADAGIVEEVIRRDNKSWKVLKVPPSLEDIEAELASPLFTDTLVKNFNSSLLWFKVGQSLSEILSGKESALPIMFAGEAAKKHPTVPDFYVEYNNVLSIDSCLSAVGKRYLQFCNEQQQEKKIIVRILEIGAGTGKFTENTLALFKEHNIEFEYTYTDISAAFFPAAEKKFEGHLKSIKFQKLNIEEDPLSQGFLPEYYDYICASDVIHATRDIKKSLRNMRMLLKPNGRFDMFEMTRVHKPCTYLFGLLDGFWLFEDSELRQKHCTLSLAEWKNVFETCGFEVVGNFPCLNEHHTLFCVNKTKDKEDDLPGFHKQIEQDKAWILFHQPDTPVSTFLHKKINGLSGRRVITVTPGDNFLRRSTSEIIIRKNVEDDFVALFETIRDSEDTMVEGVIYAWSLNGISPSLDKTLQPYFYAAKAIANFQQTPSPRLFSITKGNTIPVEGCDLSDNVHSSTVSGLTRSFRSERDTSNTRSIDIAGMYELDPDHMMQVFYEIWTNDKVSHVAFQDKSRFVPKLKPKKPVQSDLKLPSGTDRFQLILPDSRAIADLQFGISDQLALSEEEIEIQIKVWALNFRDVLNVIKPSEEFKNYNTVGYDFAGVVKRIGSKVTKWKVGDHVFGARDIGHALPSHIKMIQNGVMRVPDDWTLSEAATLPVVAASAYHCLINFAKLKKTDTVLLHTASGGVGLAAIQICQHIGAKIICTAGSSRKRRFLRSLGVQHVFHSRNTEYADKILEVTGGRGVDVVLNSLTSEGFKEATLRACAKNARFAEMSKWNIWQPEEIKSLRPDISYEILVHSSLEGCQWLDLVHSMEQSIQEKIISPIPYVRFDGVRIREALGYLQKAKHIGKVVCVLPEVRRGDTGHMEEHTPMFNSRSTYLITGGLGGIGFLVCKWMVEKHGAKHIILAGRTPPNSAMKQQIHKLNKDNDSNVIASQLDVANYDQCKALLHSKITSMNLPPLRGIMHAAGSLQDGLIQNMDWPSFASPLKAKVTGTENLHQLSKNMRLEHFVMFSSMASLLGSPGQANHTAGNTFEDVLAHYRHSVGLPATTVNWGLWGEVGIATEIDLPGVRPFSNVHGLAGLEYAMKSQKTQLSYINIDSVVLFNKLWSNASSYLDERVWQAGSRQGALTIRSDEFWEKYDSFPEDARDDKVSLVKTQVGLILRNILKLDDHDVIDEDANMQDMGVDSLMFVEIKNSIQTLLGDRVTVSANALRDASSLKLLSTSLFELIEGGSGELSKPPTLEEVAALIREDAVLPEHIRAEEGQISEDIRKARVVLLTGSTGTLGQYMLRELTTGPYTNQLTQVICLMRPHGTESGEDRLRTCLQKRYLLSQVDMKKIRVVEGNVALKHLGLGDSFWEELSNKVDAVFHCAAHVQHLEQYRKKESTSDLRAVNVQGIKNILEFCCAGEKLKHLWNASSLVSEAQVDKHGVVREDWPEIGDYDGLTTFAYPISKFVGDLLLKEAVQKRGIRAKVFRFPLIVGDSESGRFTLEQNHLMLRYLFILQTGVMPCTPVPLLLLPVDLCASISTRLFFDTNCPNDIYNLCHHQPELEQEFVGVADKLGYKVELVELSEFTGKLKMSLVEDSPFALFKDIYSDEKELLRALAVTPVLQHWLLEGYQNKDFFLSRKISSYAPDFYENLKPIMDYVYSDLSFAKRQGWLQQYGL